MPLFNFSVIGTVKVPEGVSSENIDITVTPAYMADGKEVKIPDSDWDVHEVEVGEVET